MSNSSALVKIGQAAKILGVSIDTLRRWEKAGRLSPVYTPGGTRLYSVAQIKGLKKPTHQTSVDSSQYSVDKHQAPNSLNTERSEGPVLRSEYPSPLTPPTQLPYLAQSNTVLEVDQYEPLDLSRLTPPAEVKQIAIPQLIIMSGVSASLLGLTVGAFFLGSAMLFPNQTKGVAGQLASSALNLLAPQMYAELSVAEVVEPAEPVRNWTLASQGQALQGEGQVLAANDVAHFLEINSSTTIGGDLTTEASAFVGLDLDVSGASTLGDTLTVSGATVLEDTLEVSGQTTLTDLIASGQVQVTGNAADTLLIQPSSDPDATTKLFTLKNAAGAEKFSLTANGDLALTGTSTLGGTLTVSGASTLQSVTATTLTTSGLATLASLKVTGVSTLTGAVAAESTLKVTGATTLSSSLEVSGATTLGSTLAVTGAATFASTINTNTLTATALTFSGSTPKISSANSQIALIGGVGVGYTGATSPAFPSLGLAVLGNVGIGTTSPSAKLEVIGNASVTGSLTIGSGSILQLADGTYSSPSLTFTSDTDTGLYRTGTNSLSLVTAGSASQTLTLDSSGNVGIGTSSPNAKFSVIGNSSIGAGYNAYSPPDNGLLVQGNVGISTSAPQGAIDVNGASYFRSNLSLTSGQLLINNGSASAPAYSFLNSPSSGLFSPIANHLSLITSGSATSGLTIAPSGFVGVGTTSPGARLAVNGGAVVGADYSSLTSPTNGLFVQGNVGIGTTASLSTLAINGGVTIGADYTKNYTAQPNNMLVQGNVGIGTTTGLGTYALSISGNAGIGGHILPIGASRDVGSSGNRWNVGYFNEVNATTIAGTVTGGSTSAADWTINSDNTSNDTETMSLTFNRGESSPGVSVTPDAVFRWDVGDKQFNLNSGLLIGSTPMDSQITDNKYGLEFSSIPFDITTSGSEHLALVPGGNVGIGTSGPGQKLAVVDASSNYIASFTKGTGNVPLYIYSDTAGSGIAPAASIRNLIYQVPGDRIAFYGNSAEVMRVTDGGNVGIGTASPTSKFQVTGGNVGIGVTSAVSTLAVNGNSTIGWGLAGVSGPASGLAVSGNVGVGTTSPLANLHVVGQCVAEGTRIRRRRKNNKGEWVEEEVPVEDIKPGDEVLSLDDVTGEFEWNKVEKTLNKGVQETLALTTASNKRILTTKAHPYLVLDRPLITQGIFEVDQSIRVEDLGRSTVVGIALGKLMFTAALHQSTKKDLLKYYQKLNKPHLFGPQIFGQALLETFKAANIYPARIIIDTEYTGYENVIRDIVKKGLPDSEIDFQPIGRKSAAHEAAIQVHLKKKEADIRLEGTGETEKDPGHKALRAVSSRTDYRKSHRPQGQILGISYYTERDLSRSKWTKTSQIKAGQYIATVDGWEKVTGIQEIKRLQTYDLQIANTHNFIGNGIVAHNTYITGNLGVGVNPATKFHILGSGTGTGVNLLTQGSTQTNFGLAVLDNGNVGIGTTVPAQLLHVDSNTDATYMRISRSSQSRYAQISPSINTTNYGLTAGHQEFETTGDLAIIAGNGGGGGDGDISFVTGSTNRMFIQSSSGNVGIGTASPGQLLSVNGLTQGASIRATGSSFTGATGAGVELQQGAGFGLVDAYDRTAGAYQPLHLDGSTLTFKASASVKMTMDANGNLGIGTASPASKLHVQTASSGLTSTSVGLNIENSTHQYIQLFTPANTQQGLLFSGGVVGTEGGIVWEDGTRGNRLDFYSGTNGTASRMTIQGSDGNIGIGTTSPVGKLDVRAGTLTLSNTSNLSSNIDWYNLSSDSVAGRIGYSFSGASPADTLSFLTAGSLKMSLNSSGNVGIYSGTTATAVQRFQVNTTTSNPFVVTSSGNVGIGFSSPSTMLYVGSNGIPDVAGSGDVYIQNDLEVDGVLNVAGAVTFGSSITPTGQILASDGTAALPGLAFSSDPDSGLWRSTSNFIHLTTGGTNTQGLAINASGNVGIGTSAPREKFTIYDAGGIGNAFENRTDTTVDKTVTIYTDTSSQILAFGNQTDFRIGSSSLTQSLSAGGFSEAMRITSGGNVGIGTASPSVAGLSIDSNSNSNALRLFGATEASQIADLYVGSTGNLIVSTVAGSSSAGYLDLRSEDDQYGVLIQDSSGATVDSAYANFYMKDASTDYLQILVNAAQTPAGTGLVIQSGGNVGIGTTSPSAKLHVTGNGTGNILIGDAGFANYGTVSLSGTLNTTSYNFTSSPSDPNLYINRPDSYNIHFREANATQMTLDADGDLGIGNASPSFKLDVTTSDAIPYVNITPTTGTSPIGYRLSNTGGQFYVGIDNSAGSNFNTGTAYAGAIWRSGTNPISFVTNSTERMRIDGSGNVGIGTASPRVKLDLRSDAVIAAPTALSSAVASGVFTIGDTVGSVFGLQLNGASYDTYIQARNMGAASTAYNLLLQPLGGNVGIGTAGPTSSLNTLNKLVDLAGGALTGYVLHSSNTAQESSYATDGSGLYFDVGGHATATNNNIIFRTEETNSQFSATERMRISSTGAVTIAAPSSGTGLTVAGGGASITGTSTSIVGQLAVQGTGGGSSTSIYQDATITASAGNAWLFRSIGNMTAAANGDILRGFGLAEGTIAKGTFTGLTAYGVLVNNYGVSGTGTIDTHYGVYIAAPTRGTTNIGLYNAGTSTLIGAVSAPAGVALTGSNLTFNEVGVRSWTMGVGASSGNLSLNSGDGAGRVLLGQGLTVGTGGAVITGTTTINTSGSATTTIGALTGTDLILQDANWNITGAGAATFASLTTGSGSISGGAGSFTTLTSSGNSTIATGAGTTNTFGNAATTTNTIGHASATLTSILGPTTVTGTVNINNTGSATTTIGNASAGAIAMSTGGAFGVTTTTSPQTFTSAVITGTGTSSAWVFNDASLTTGTGMYIQAANITSGKFFDINNGSSIFSVSNTAFSTSLPTEFSSSGDVSIAYDLNFTNPTASFIKSAAPFSIVAGETFASSNLSLVTYNSGDIVFDSPGGATINQTQTWTLNSTAIDSLNFKTASGTNILSLGGTGNVGIGTTAPLAKLVVSTGLANTGEPTYVGTMRIQDAGGLETSIGGLEFKAAASASGYGFRITNPDLGTGETPLYFQRRSNSATWSNAMTILGTNGNVGIGTISPSAPLTIGTALTSWAAGGTRLFDLNGSFATDTDNDIAAMRIGTTFAPGGAISNAYGLRVEPTFNPASGATTSVQAVRIVASTGSGAGSITNLYGQIIQQNYGTIKPTTAYGSYIDNIGSASITNSYGLYVAAQSGSTNNYAAVFAGGNVGIGTATPNSLLRVEGEIAGSLFKDTSNFSYYVDPGNSTTAAVLAGSIYAHDGAGLVVGHSSKLTISDGGGTTSNIPEAQILDTSRTGSTLLLGNFQNSSANPSFWWETAQLAFLKSNSGTIGTSTALADTSVLGEITWYGADGTDLKSVGAKIRAQVDGTPGTGDMPGALLFLTTADGAEDSTERMRIQADGDLAVDTNTLFVDAAGNKVGIGTATPGALLEVFSTSTRMTVSTAGRLALPTTGASAGIVLGTTNTVTLTDSATDAERAGTARRTYQVTLAPEFQGATLTAAVGLGSSGNMTSDFCSFGLTINNTAASGCPNSGETHNFYQWVSTAASTEYYDIWVRWQVPTDFDAWASSNPIKAYGFRTGTSDSVEIVAYDTTTTARVTTEAATTNNTWTQTNISTGAPTGTWTPGGYASFRIRLKSTGSSNYARIGEIELYYLSKFK